MVGLLLAEARFDPPYDFACETLASSVTGKLKPMLIASWKLTPRFFLSLYPR